MTKNSFSTNAWNLQNIIHESGFSIKICKNNLSINVCSGEKVEITKQNILLITFIRQTYYKFC